MRKLIFGVVMTAVLLGALGQAPQGWFPSGSSGAEQDAILQRAYDTHQSNLQVVGSGTVTKILPDDLDGSRHQRFILRLSNGQTLLVAHNIDLAPRLSGIGVGDQVEFRGEFEWNSRGGVVHWTHRDPGGRHDNGWLKHGGRIYQ